MVISDRRIQMLHVCSSRLPLHYAGTEQNGHEIVSEWELRLASQSLFTLGRYGYDIFASQPKRCAKPNIITLMRVANDAPHCACGKK